MREGVGISSRRLEGPRRCTTQPPQSAGLSDFKPGYLDLSPEVLERLVSKEPIEKFYEVEDEPFGRGKYATVRRCRHRVNGLVFAAKFLRRRRRSTDLRYEILHEVAVLEACAPSIRIVNLYQVFETSTEMILLLELAPGGELQALLDRDEIPDENTARRIMRQVVDGIQYLHSLNIAHLDIKPQNIVLTDTYPDCDVQLCDFGISRYVGEDDDIREILGTPDYVAPEVLNYEAISLATDMWSIGVLMYVLLTGCCPFGGETKQETFCNISRGDLDFPDDLFQDISETAKDLMTQLMVKDPRSRLTASECLEHEWFQQHSEMAPSPIPEIVINTVSKPLSRAPSIRVSTDQLKQQQNDELLLRQFRSVIGHEKNINRASALVRNPSLRRSVDQNSEMKKATASKTVPVHVFACLKALEKSQTRQSREIMEEKQKQKPPKIQLPIFIPSSLNMPPPSFAPPLRPAFIDTPPSFNPRIQPDVAPRPEDLPSVTSSETSSISSDSVSEMSVDSSGDCSSLMSSDDPCDWEQPGWVRECSGSLQRAMSRFNISPPANPQLATRRSFCTSTPSLFVPDNRNFGLKLLKEQNGNEVVIREVKAGRVSRFSEVKCESVRSRIKKFQARS